MIALVGEDIGISCRFCSGGLSSMSGGQIMSVICAIARKSESISCLRSSSRHRVHVWRRLLRQSSSPLWASCYTGAHLL